jgi:hypothetical protein
MAFIHGKSAGVLYGAYDLSAFFNEASMSQSVETAETTTFGSGAKSYITGLKDGTFSLSGMFDGVAAGIDEVISASVGDSANVPITIIPQQAATMVVSDVSFSGETLETSYEVSSPVGDVVSANMEGQITGGMDRGIILAPKTVVSATATGTSVDQTASTTNGGVGYLHVTANTRNGAITVKVQHSSDNSTFADLITFTSVSSTTIVSERIAVTGTVNRYVRASYTVAGSSGSATTTVAFSRK